MKDNKVLNFLTLPVSIAFSHYLTYPLCDLFGYEHNPWFYFVTFFGSIILLLYVAIPILRQGVANPIKNFFFIIFSVVISAATSFLFTPNICNWLDQKTEPVSYFVVFFGTFILQFFIYFVFIIWNWRRKKKNEDKHEERKFNENVSLRLIKGSFINFCFLPITYILLVLIWDGYINFVHILRPSLALKFVEIMPNTVPTLFTKYTANTNWEPGIYTLIVIFVGGSFIGLHFGLLEATAEGWPDIKQIIGRLIVWITPTRFRHGRGGSASFGRLFEDWAAKYKPGMILIGASLYEPFLKLLYWRTYKIGIEDDMHLITVAATRGGKGRSAIIPNLIEWKHSALVIDPKGTNTSVTAARRGYGSSRVTNFLKQNVHIIDPFHQVSKTTAGFNPMAEIDLNSDRVMEDIGLITDALVVKGTSKNSDHFDELAKTIISGVIAHLLTKDSNATLLDVINVFTMSNEEKEVFFTEMEQNKGAARLPVTAASALESAGPEEGGSFFTTVLKNIKWINSVAMKDVFKHSSFKLSDLKNGKTTIYIILPPELLDQHQRFQRMFLNLAVGAMSKGGKAKNPVLFIMDEFSTLGYISKIEQAAALLAGYNLKLWPIIQNIDQLQKIYPQSWETFFNNAGIEQYFSLSGDSTLKYLSNKLGTNAYGNVTVNLREPSELAQEIGRGGGRQIILRGDKKPLLLRRTNYDKIFSKNMYSPDPDHPNS